MQVILGKTEFETAMIFLDENSRFSVCGRRLTRTLSSNDADSTRKASRPSKVSARNAQITVCFIGSFPHALMIL